MSIKRSEIISFTNNAGGRIIYTATLPSNDHGGSVLYGSEGGLFRRMRISGFRGNIVAHSFQATLPGIGLVFEVVRDYSQLSVNGQPFTFCDTPINPEHVMTPRHLLQDERGNRYCVVSNLQQHDYDALQVHYCHYHMPVYMRLETIGPLLHSSCKMCELKTEHGSLRLPLPDSDKPFSFRTKEGDSHPLTELNLADYALEVYPAATVP